MARAEAAAVFGEQPLANIAPALHRRLVHGGVAVVVEDREVEAAVAEPAAHREGVGAAVGGLSRPLHRIAAERVACVEVGARAVDEPLGDGEVALPHAPVQRRRAVACARVRVEAARDEPARHVEVAVAARPVQRSAAVGLRGVYQRRRGGGEQFARRKVTAARRPHQRVRAVAVDRGHVAARPQRRQIAVARRCEGGRQRAARARGGAGTFRPQLAEPAGD